MKQRLVAILLVLTMIFSLTACGGSAKKEIDASHDKTPSGENGVSASADNPWAGLVDTSKEETMVVYVIGNKPNDMDLVLDKINERLMTLINTKIEINFISLADWTTKYPLVLTGGDDIDLVYTSGWTSYTDEARKGAFYELTEDFISKYMPQTKVREPEAAWKQALVDGKKFGIPRSYTENQSYGAFVIRKDIMDKYGISEIKNFDDLEKFLFVCAENETDGYGYNAFPSLPMFGELVVPQENIFAVANNLYWDADDAPSADNLQYLYLMDEYHNYVLRMRDWAKKGVWPSSAISSTTHTTDQWNEGKSFINGARLEEAAPMKEAVASKGYEAIFVNLMPEGTYTRLSNYSGDMMAISAFSKNPERAAVVLDILKFDRDTELMCQGGIEGKHYIINDDGTRSNGPDSDNYAWSCWAWGLRDVDTFLQLKVSDDITQVAKEYAANQMPDDMWIFDGFKTDDSKYEAEIAIINAIVNEYQYSFDLGVYGDDTEAKYQEFVGRLKEAGLDDVMAEWKRQAKEYTGK